MSKFKTAYDEICNKESANMIAQGLSGIAGFPWALGVDAAVIPTIYMPLLSNLRGFFGRVTNQTDKAKDLVLQIVPEILVDMVFDKVAGQIPLIGIFFNAICAKNMTWRLGILFTMLSARGEEIHSDKVSDCMKLIRAEFPQEGFWKFKRPTFNKFEELCASFVDISPSEFNTRVDKKLKQMKIDAL